MTTKICTKCGVPKDKEKDFSWSITGIKRQSQCRSCRSEERSERYQNNKEAELAYKWDRQQRKREEARAFVDAYCTSSEPLGQEGQFAKVWFPG
jgi:hypothetical protein